MVLVFNAKAGGVFRVDLHERTGVQLVQRRDLAGLGHGVPLVLQATGVEYEGEFLVRHFRWRHVRTSQEYPLTALGGKHDGGSTAIGLDLELLAYAVVQVANRITILGVD
ncbi:hypothetical protein D3C80_572110 [compost metagenome]